MEHAVEKNHVRPVARAGPVSRALAGAALAVLACLVLAGCSKTTKPKDVKYNIYIGAWGYRDSTAQSQVQRFYVYDADSLTLLDSIPLPTPAMTLAVSPDGRWLYANCTSWGDRPGGLYKIDARTKQIIWSDHTRRLLAVLDGGRLLLAGDNQGAAILHPDDGQLIGRLPPSVATMQGPPNGTKIAAVMRDSSAATWDTVVTVLDVKTGVVYGNYVPRLASGQALEIIHTARLHPDGRRVMVIGLYGWSNYCWFMIGDVMTGETLFRERFYSPFGEIAISEDGTLVVASDPSYPQYGESRQAVEFFDLHTMQHLKTLDWESGLHTIVPTQIRFLPPGDHRIAIAPESWWPASGPFSIVDRATLTVTNTVWLPSEHDEPIPGALGAGPRP